MNSYYQKHKEQIKRVVKRWQKKNPEKVRKYYREYYIKEQKKKNPNWIPCKERKSKDFWVIRKEVLQRDNYRCQMCDSKKRIEIHHIDGTGSNRKTVEMNNELENLIALCHKCHMQVEINKVGNFNKGKWHEDTERNKNIYRLSKKMKQIKIAKLKGLTRQRINQIVQKYRKMETLD